MSHRICGTMHCQYCLAKLFIYMNEQEDVIPNQGDPVDGTIDLAKELYNKLGRLRGRTQLTYSDGSKGFADFYRQDEGHRGPSDYRLSVWVTYYPDGDNPIIPNELVSLGVKKMLERILFEIPEIKSYPKEVFDKFSFALGQETIYYKEGIMHVADVLPSAEKNVLLADYSFYEFIHNIDNSSNLYVIQNPPKFSEDYSLAMDKSVKKLKTIYKAFEKGKWKGYDYELSKNPTYVVHQRFSKYDKESRIVFPEFTLGVTTGYATFNGTPSNKMDDQELVKEFMTLMKKKFEHFGITFS